MIACDQHVRYFEELSRYQEQIYNDACDFGVWITETTRAVAREHMMELMNCYGYKMEKWEGGNSTILFVPIELADYGFGQYDGMVIEVSFLEARTTHPSINSKEAASNAVGFLSINFSRKTLILVEATEQYGYKD